MEKYFEIAKEKFAKLQKKDNVLILGIESSCDETSISIVKNGREILSNVIATQIEIHRRFGGVVPEVASRNHIEAINNVLEEALHQANVKLEEIDAIGVTYGAGLVGALLVGVNFAKSLAYSLSIPLIAVSHIEGHISANYLSHKNLEPPFMCLMISGGHTAILEITDYTHHKLIGTTIDDAVGEAFDKVARILGLQYPGGVEIDNHAKNGKSDIKFTKHNSLQNTFDFSFSGIKTAVINFVNNKKQKSEEVVVDDVCASFQTQVVEELSNKTIKACKFNNANKLVIAGGVGANSFLRARLGELCKENEITLYYPDLKLCTDNAAMIASNAFYNLKANKNLAPLTLTATPTVKL